MTAGEDPQERAVTSGKLAPKSVIAGKLGPNAVLPGNIGNGAVTSAKIGAGAVIAASIKNGVDHHQQTARNEAGRPAAEDSANRLGDAGQAERRIRPAARRR